MGPRRLSVWTGASACALLLCQPDNIDLPFGLVVRWWVLVNRHCWLQIAIPLGNREMFLVSFCLAPRGSRCYLRYALTELDPKSLLVNWRQYCEESSLHNFQEKKNKNTEREKVSFSYKSKKYLQEKSWHLHLHIGNVLCCTETTRSGSKWQVEVTFWN